MCIKLSMIDITCLSPLPRLPSFWVDSRISGLVFFFFPDGHRIRGLKEFPKPIKSRVRCYSLENATAQCPKCMRLYRYKKSLSRHLRYECGQLPQFKCPFCNKLMSQKSSLVAHMERKHRRLMNTAVQMSLN